MSKKALKILVTLAAVITFIAGVIYLINSKRNKVTVCEGCDDCDANEEHLDAADALDLSSLKFSRHYVDLR